MELKGETLKEDRNVHQIEDERESKLGEREIEEQR